jgi:hypothetical protein
MQKACGILEDNMHMLYLHRFDNPASIERTMATMQQISTAEFKKLALPAEQIQNLTSVLNAYGKYLIANPDALTQLPSKQGLTQYLQTLTQQSATITTDITTLKRNLQQLEIDCYQNGMQILHPEQVAQIAATARENCSIANLKMEHKKSTTEYDEAVKSGKLHVITNALAPEHYAQVVIAKKNIFAAINKYTGFAVKFADLLRDHCTLLYKGFHFIACLNPLSTYKSVILMREVHEQLKLLQKKLEAAPNIYGHDKTSQNYILAIEEINKTLQELPKNAGRNVKDKHYKELRTLLVNFNEHQKHLDKPAEPSPSAKPPAPRQEV